MTKAIINPVNGAKIREFTYVFEVKNLESGELSNIMYVFVTDGRIPPTLWNNRSDSYRNARPELAEEFIKNGDQWYDFTGYCPSHPNSGIVKIDPPHGDGPDGFKIHTDYRLTVNFEPGKYYSGSGRIYPYQWQVQRPGKDAGEWICVEHGVADDFDIAVQMGKAAFEALKI